MFDKNIDVVLAGNSYLAFILSNELAKRNKSSLLIDDSRIGHGQLLSGFLSELEISFLEAWGEVFDLSPLKNIKDYVTISPYTIVINGKRVRVGDRPSRNLMEIGRKLKLNNDNNTRGRFFKDLNISKDGLDGFNDEFFKFCSFAGKEILKNDMSNDDIKNLLFENSPANILSLYTAISEADFGESGLAIDESLLFNYILSGIYHQKLTFEYDELELFHLIVSVISPRYVLDVNKISKDILSHTLDLGGSYKKTDIIDCSCFNNKAWALQLESYEGVVLPDEIFLFTESLKNYPFEFKDKKNYYNSYYIDWKLKEDLPVELVGELFVIGECSTIGTDNPFILLDIKSIDTVICSVFYNPYEGTKIDYIENRVAADVTKKVSQIIPNFETLILSCSAEKGKEIIISEFRTPNSKLIVSKNSNFKDILINNSNFGIGRSSVLKKIKNIGPYQNNNIGVLSMLCQLKKCVDKI